MVSVVHTLRLLPLWLGTHHVRYVRRCLLTSYFPHVVPLPPLPPLSPFASFVTQAALMRMYGKSWRSISMCANRVDLRTSATGRISRSCALVSVRAHRVLMQSLISMCDSHVACSSRACVERERTTGGGGPAAAQAILRRWPRLPTHEAVLHRQAPAQQLEQAQRLGQAQAQVQAQQPWDRHSGGGRHRYRRRGGRRATACAGAWAGAAGTAAAAKAGTAGAQPGAQGARVAGGRGEGRPPSREACLRL